MRPAEKKARLGTLWQPKMPERSLRCTGAFWKQFLLAYDGLR